MARGVRFGILIGVSVGVFCTLGFGIYVRACVDMEALRAAHEDRLFTSLFNGEPALQEMEHKLVHFHKGTPPCALYGGKVEIPDAERAVIERDLRGAGLLLRIRENVTLFWRWGRRDEQRRHGETTDEEILTEWNMTATGYERAAAFFAGHALAESVRAATAKMENRQFASADAEQAKLSHEELEALQGIWLRHPTAMSPPGLFTTLMKLPRE